MATYPETLDGNPPPVRRRGAWNFLTRRLPSLAFMLLVLFLAVTVLWRFVVITVPAGHVGVLWKRFNTFDYYCWCFAGRGTMLNPQQLRGKAFTSFGRGITCSSTIFVCNPRRRPTMQYREMA
jgi:hypothetical protein